MPVLDISLNSLRGKFAVGYTRNADWLA